MDYKTAVQAALNGDEDGFLYLYENTYTKMYHKALTYVKNKCDAEDILQESYIKAEKNLGTLTEPDKFPIWFSEIVANTSKNFLKSKKRKPVTFLDYTIIYRIKKLTITILRITIIYFSPKSITAKKRLKKFSAK